MVTRTVRTFTSTVRVRVSQGESIQHAVNFRGGTAVFRIVDDQSHSVILSDEDPGPIYRTSWPHGPGANTAQGFACSFADATQYTWQVAIVTANGARTLVVDVDYSSNDGTDMAADAITVLVR